MMQQPERILVMETSALLAMLREFTDAYAVNHHAPEATEAFEALLREQSVQGSVVDQIVIPDHVLYEVTGLLPICHAHMLQRFAEAHGDAAKLADMIELYALASPRGEVGERKGEQKRHIQLLLRFIAEHPESLVPTQTGATYCARLRADYAVMSATNGSTMNDYRPSFADALHHVGDTFNPDPLRIHAGQMLMMGMIDEEEFNERLGMDEKILGRKKRFYKAQGVIQRLEQQLSGKIDQSFFDTVRGQEGLNGPGATQVDLTFGMLRRHPQLLPPHAATADDRLPLQAIGPCTLLMEHYLFGGLLPHDAPAILAMANALGFDVDGLHADGDVGRIAQQLRDQGFYELSPTMAQLSTLQTALQHAGYPTDTLQTLTRGIRQVGMPQMQQFKHACAATENAVPYEKVFSDALVNGVLQWDEFWQLAGEGMHREYAEGYYGNERADILVRPERDNRASILVAQQGFTARRGPIPLGYVTSPIRSYSFTGRNQPYIEFTPDELIQRCRLRMNQGRHAGPPLHSVLETMLLRPVVQNPVALREKAEGLLGPERLLQIEKDYANRHSRRAGQRQPPYADLLTALHTNSRIQRKNLGEVATLEAAQQVRAQYPQAHVWIANHDSDLVPTQARNGDVALEASVVRQHAGFMPTMRGLNQRVAGDTNLHFLSTPRLLDDVYRLMQRTPPASYEHLLLKRHRSPASSADSYGQLAIKRIITDFPNTSWDLLMRRTLGAGTQR